MDKLLDTMRRLRAPGGCPWDREQTHESLRPYLLEEAAEATDALAEGAGADFVSELGDVLLQIAFHAVIGEEEGTFSYGDVEDAIVTKLIRRHPHVFGDVKVRDSDDVRINWLAIKEQERLERGEETGGADVPSSLPVLMRIQELQRKGGLKNAEPDDATADVTADSVGRAIIDLVLQASGAGVNAELAVRDELARMLKQET